jgi:hypothetical protein
VKRLRGAHSEACRKATSAVIRRGSMGAITATIVSELA